jgi:hypothetical protein
MSTTAPPADLEAKAHEAGFMLVKTDDWVQTRAIASMLGQMSARFVADGEGDCFGPELAEPGVWARLHQLEAGEKGTGVDAGGLGDAIMRELGIDYGDHEKHPDWPYSRTVKVISDWFKTPKEVAER